jgi:SAM-dependent methyltransferase
MAYNKNLISELYGEPYHGSNKFGNVPGGFKHPSHWSEMSRWNRIAEDICLLVSPRRVLEIGCGRGSLVRALRDKGVDAYGIDISEWAVRNVIDPSLSPFIRHLAAQDLETAEKFDLIIALDVIEHIPYDFYSDTFTKFSSIADKIALSVPTSEAPPFRADSSRVLEHYVRLSIKEWESEFEGRGYRSISYSGANFFPFDKKNTENYPFILEKI